jgi:hypothetical protein
MNRLRFCLAVLFASVVPTADAAIDLSTGGNDDSKIAERGQSPSGCREADSKQRMHLRGKWIALTPDSLQSTKPFVAKGTVRSADASEKFFFSGIPLQPGEVQNATVKPLRTGTTARTEAEIVLGESRYRFVEWGADGFALERLTPSSATVRLQVFGMQERRIPKEAFVKTQQPRDSYEPGTLKVVRAADLNRDGIVDLLLRYHSKEADGLVLWLSDSRSKRHRKPIYSATTYGDC